MLRDSRNGVECFGFFSTSAVKELKAKDEDGSFLFETKNSIYKFEELKD
jgi:hypothetical protein